MRVLSCVPLFGSSVTWASDDDLGQSKQCITLLVGFVCLGFGAWVYVQTVRGPPALLLSAVRSVGGYWRTCRVLVGFVVGLRGTLGCQPSSAGSGHYVQSAVAGKIESCQRRIERAE